MSRISRKYRVAFLVDGSFLPIRNGTYYSIFHLMNTLYDSNKVEPFLILSYRGWDKPNLYYGQKFSTVFLKTLDYYSNTGTLEHILNHFSIDIIHVYNSEEVIGMLSRLKSKSFKIIYEAVNIDHVLYERLGEKPKVLSKIKNIQSKAMTLCDAVLCRSVVDKNYILHMGIAESNIHIYRGAINIKEIKFKIRVKKNYKLVFLGHMYYPPNEEALNFMHNIIIPGLKKYSNRYSVTVIGSVPKYLVKKYSSKYILFKGGVDNLSDELLKYDIALAPIKSGSGTRLKILDYLASGIPVISTRLGIEGLENQIRKCLIIEDNLDKYADLINKIEEDLHGYKHYSKRGRNFVIKYYNWSDNIDVFINLYNKLMNNHYEKRAKTKIA